MNKILLSLLLFISFSVNAQNFFRKYYGGAMDEETSHISPTPDGNYSVSGMTLSYGSGNADAYVVKIDPSGNVIWSKTYGDVDDDFAEWIEPTKDNGYAICGYTFSQLIQDSKIFILKTDSLGTIEWQKQIKLTTVARAYCIRQTSDDGFIISGEEDSTGLDGNMLLVKIDSLGNLLWSKSFGIPANADVGQYIEETHDHGFAVCGMSRYGLYSSFAMMLKTDSAGNQEWSKTYYDQIPSNSKIYPNKIQELNDGSFIVSGSSFQIGSPLSGILLLKTDSSGNIIWSDLYSTGNGDGSTDLSINENGTEYFLCGYSSDSLSGNRNALIMKTDSQGVLLWNNLYGNDTLDASFNALTASVPYGFYLTGSCYTYGLGMEDIFIMNTDSAGSAPTCALHQALFTSNSLPLTNNGSLSAYPLTVTLVNLNFSTSSGVQTADVCLANGISPDPKLSAISVFYSRDENSLHIANPANEIISGLEIFDALGRKVYENSLNTSIRQVEVNMDEISGGVYLLNIFSKSEKLSRKFAVN
jgi:hypothetical protein